MADLPIVTVIVTTYLRTAIAKATLESFKRNLIYPNLRWIIADDGSPAEHVETLKTIFGPDDIVDVTNAQRKGVGYSKNIALRHAFNTSPFVFLSEDDWLLTKPFPIEAYVRLLQDKADIGMIRLGYLGGETTATYEGDSFISYWRLKRGSGVYIYSGQVSLRHERFYKSTGFHSENCSPGEEELEFCIRFNASDGCPDIIWPAIIPCQFNSGLFVHIGETSTNTVQPENT